MCLPTVVSSTQAHPSFLIDGPMLYNNITLLCCFLLSHYYYCCWWYLSGSMCHIRLIVLGRTNLVSYTVLKIKKKILTSNSHFTNCTQETKVLALCVEQHMSSLIFNRHTWVMLLQKTTFCNVSNSSMNLLITSCNWMDSIRTLVVYVRTNKPSCWTS